MWGAVIGAAVTVVGSIYAAKAQAEAQGRPYKHIQVKRDELAHARAEHKARMAAEHRKTMQQATIGTVLLLALAVTVIIGILQLMGVIR